MSISPRLRAPLADIHLLLSAQQPVVGRDRGCQVRSLPRELSLTLRLLAHPTTFICLGLASAHRILQERTVAILATAARPVARLLGRPGQQEW